MAASPNTVVQLGSVPVVNRTGAYGTHLAGLERHFGPDRIPQLCPQNVVENLVLCGEHGPGLYCHVNEDGGHVDATFCLCHRRPELCPIDIHRQLFLKAATRGCPPFPDVGVTISRPSALAPEYLRLPEPTAAEDGSVHFGDAGWLGAPAEQLQKAEIMHKAGLKTKATRQAYCGLFGKTVACETCETKFYITNGCENRYCPHCARRIFDKLFKEYLKLQPVAQRIVPYWPIRPGQRIPMHHVIAKVDIMPINTGVMPIPAEIRKFNENVRKFFRVVAEKFVLPSVKLSDVYLQIQNDPDLAEKEKRNRVDRLVRDSYGFLWVDEFGGNPTAEKVRQLRLGKVGNTNLHAHGFYAGPWLPNKHNELSLLWEEVTGTKAFFSIAPARGVHAALAHALKYAGKFLSADPRRLAELEVAFHRVRRVHTLGAFYNVKSEEEEGGSDFCPCCEAQGYQARLLDPSKPWLPVKQLREGGIRDLEEVRREQRKARVLRFQVWDAGG